MPPSVGVITPHTEQQAFLVQLVSRQDDAERLNEGLDLKIMTFDTCQGEERDVILYSMVATPLNDKLAYVFPKSLEDADEVDHVLRQQRLNVGFSRAKERIHFFMSKPIEDFSGRDRQSAAAFQGGSGKSEDGAGPADTDPKSPMEKRLLGMAKPDAAHAARLAVISKSTPNIRLASICGSWIQPTSTRTIKWTFS